MGQGRVGQDGEGPGRVFIRDRSQETPLGVHQSFSQVASV